MKPGRGKNKGNRFELEVCRRLSLWVSDGQEKDLFMRSSSSGATATVRKKAGSTDRRLAGDISALEPRAALLLSKFFVECKHVQDAEYLAFLFRGTGKTAKFFKKAVEEAWSYDKLPLLIIRQNNYPVMLFTTEPLSAISSMDRLTFLDPVLSSEYFTYPIYAYHFETFLQWPFRSFCVDAGLRLSSLIHKVKS